MTWLRVLRMRPQLCQLDLRVQGEGCDSRKVYSKLSWRAGFTLGIRIKISRAALGHTGSFLLGEASCGGGRGEGKEFYECLLFGGVLLTAVLRGRKSKDKPRWGSLELNYR
jgi:hypothetical protein